jgi:hypothetical protein
MKNANTHFLLTATLFTLFLFYIDEGYYSFQWMSSLSNWATFFVYIGMLYSTQGILFQLFRRLLKKPKLLSVIFGLSLGLWLLFAMFR